MRHSLVAGAAATVGSGLLANGNFAVAQDASGGKPTKGDVAILQFLAAAEIIESDLWLQYQELGGVQDDEVSSLASKLLPGYPAHFKFTHHVEPGPESLNLTDVPAYRLSICYIRSVFTSSLT